MQDNNFTNGEPLLDIRNRHVANADDAEARIAILEQKYDAENWDTLETYQADQDLVWFTGTLYRCIVNTATGESPTTDPAKWDQVTLTATEIKTLYESNSDTNEYSDAEKSKLGDIDQDVSTTGTPTFAKVTADNVEIDGNTIKATTGDLVIEIDSATDSKVTYSKKAEEAETRYDSKKGIRIVLNADSDNSDESDVARMVFLGDGEETEFIIGQVGEAGKDPDGGNYAGTSQNDLLIGGKSIGDRVQLGVENEVQMTVENDRISVKKQIEIVGGSPAAGKVLTAFDSSGLGTWEAPIVVTDGFESSSTTEASSAKNAKVLNEVWNNPSLHGVADWDTFQTAGSFRGDGSTITNKPEGFNEFSTILVFIIADKIIQIAMDGGGTKMANRKFTTAQTNIPWAIHPDADAFVEFANTAVQFDGEKGLPSAQGFNENVVGPSTLSVFADSDVFGRAQQVIRFVVDSATNKVDSALDGDKWDDIFINGGAFLFDVRITNDIDTQSIFTGIGFSTVNDPRTSSIRSRIGVFVSVDATHTTVRLEGQSTVVLDGTGGKPLVLKDEWFNGEVFINKSPDGLVFGTAILRVNGIDIVTGGIVSAANDAVTNQVSIANSSTTGQSTFYVAKFGMVVYESDDTRTFTATEMLAPNINVVIPDGGRITTLIFPDGSPRPVGDTVSITAKNVNGKLILRTENLGTPETLIADLASVSIDIFVKTRGILINTVDQSNTYETDLLSGLIRDSLGNPGTEGQILAALGLGKSVWQDFIDLKPINGATQKEGRVYYDVKDKALSLKTDIVGSTQSLGQEFWVRVINKTGVQIDDGKAVYINGFDVPSGRPTVALAKADAVSTADAVGFVTNTMADDAEGFVTTMGFLNDLDTSSFSAGVPIFLSSTTAGDFTDTKPTLVVPMGFVTRSDVSTGQVFTTISRSSTDSPIFAQLSSSVDQEPTVTTPVVIEFNTQDAIQGLSHSTTVNPGEITVDIGGTYFILAQPQVGKDSGGTAQTFDMFAQSDRGSGFDDEVNSNVKLTVRDAGDDDVIVAGATINLSAGDKIRFEQRVSSSSVGMGLKFTAAETGPPTVPATPSIIFTMFRAGGEL